MGEGKIGKPLYLLYPSVTLTFTSQPLSPPYQYFIKVMLPITTQFRCVYLVDCNGIMVCPHSCLEWSVEEEWFTGEPSVVLRIPSYGRRGNRGLVQAECLNTIPHTDIKRNLKKTTDAHTGADPHRQWIKTGIIGA